MMTSTISCFLQVSCFEGEQEGVDELSFSLATQRVFHS
uniref:Uncharacterized protein n=1 Tax=Populus trichocarpa TaxID=3694 RepID=A9PDL2_POPTR|nr:unknown [Populus trichocarpa]